jgi:sugar/nucleoside kinase (ribokinase family)
MFLSEEELETLTGFRRKSKQIAQLKQMGVAFLVNACGHPVVLRASLEGRKDSKAPSKPEWRPSWAGAQR